MKTLVLILFYGFQQCFPSRQFCRFYHVISETSKIKLGVNLRCFSKLHSRKQSLWFLRKHAGYFLSVFWGKTAWKTLDMILQCFHRKLPENCVSLFPMLFSMFRSITSIIACSVSLSCDSALWAFPQVCWQWLSSARGWELYVPCQSCLPLHIHTTNCWSSCNVSLQRRSFIGSSYCFGVWQVLIDPTGFPEIGNITFRIGENELPHLCEVVLFTIPCSGALQNVPPHNICYTLLFHKCDNVIKLWVYVPPNYGHLFFSTQWSSV